MGLQDGDVIAMILPNMPESPISLLGAMEAGLVVTAVNPIYTVGKQKNHIFNNFYRNKQSLHFHPCTHSGNDNA